MREFIFENILFFRFIAWLLIFSVVFGLVEKLAKRNSVIPSFKTVSLDLLYSLSNFLIAFVGTLTLGKLFTLLFPNFYVDMSWIGKIGVVSQFLLALLLIDFNAYWSHRLMHFGWFWPLHAIHHSSKTMYWLATERSHPINFAFGLFLSFGILGNVISYEVLRFAGLFSVAYGYFIHTGIKLHYGRFNKLLVSPVFHHWHHSVNSTHYNSNYAGMFSFYDVLFGTYNFNKNPVLPDAVGVNDERLTETLTSQFYYPFLMLTALFRKK